MLVIRFNQRKVRVKDLIRVVQIEVAALRLPTRKLLTDAVNENLPNGLTRNLNNFTGELWYITLRKWASHCS